MNIAYVLILLLKISEITKTKLIFILKVLIEYIINNKLELRKLLSHHKVSFLPWKGNIKLLLEHLSENEKLRWEKKLSRYFFECGCDIGAKFAIVSILLYILYLFTLTEITNLLRWQTVA